MNNDVLSKNLNVVTQRFPEIRQKLDKADLASLSVEVEQNTLLVNGIQLTSNYDRIAEAEIQAGLIPMESKVAYVYGVGLGDLPEVLLKRENIEKIFVCILNFNLFVHVLNVVDLNSWLSDERIILVDSNTIKEVYFPFAAVPAELILVENNAAKLRDRIVLELDNDFIHDKHNDNSLFSEAMEINMDNIINDPSVDDLILDNVKRVYIAAAGPTLSEHIVMLQKNQKLNKPIPVIAVDAALKALLANNIYPDVVVSIDHASHFALEGIDFTKFQNTALVYFPIISREILNKWSSKRYCAYSSSIFYQKIDTKYPKRKLYVSGSVIHPTIDLVVQKGAKEVVLLGADFGFPNDQAYVEGQKIIGTDHYTSSSHWVLNGRGKRITTLLNYRGYLRDLERYIEAKPYVKFINGSAEGAKIEGTTLLK